MPTNIITRDKAEVLIPEEVSSEIIQGAVASSAALTQFRRLPNMASNVRSQPVLATLPMAYWVNGDTGQKRTTEVSWDKINIYAEELAVIVPIPEAVVEDALSAGGYDLFGEIRPLIEERMGAAIDEAILFGINKPTMWRKSLIETAQETGNFVTPSASLYQDIFGVDGAIANVEKSGFIPNGSIASVGMRGALRGLVDLNNRPLFLSSLQDGAANYNLDGMPTSFLMNGAWQDAEAQLILGDMSQAVYAIRKDITYKLLTESIIQNTDGTIAYNLAQQDKPIAA